ncbi:hypothetical protein ACFQ9X_29415 [Catenulispora yoronensis]
MVSNAGGVGVLAADACVEAGLTVAEFGDGLRQRLQALLGPGAAVANPVDAGAARGPTPCGRPWRRCAPRARSTRCWCCRSPRRWPTCARPSPTGRSPARCRSH